jgi:hypothetical protein
MPAQPWKMIKRTGQQGYNPGFIYGYFEGWLREMQARLTAICAIEYSGS